MSNAKISPRVRDPRLESLLAPFQVNAVVYPSGLHTPSCWDRRDNQIPTLVPDVTYRDLTCNCWQNCTDPNVVAHLKAARVFEYLVDLDNTVEFTESFPVPQSGPAPAVWFAEVRHRLPHVLNFPFSTGELTGVDGLGAVVTDLDEYRKHVACQLVEASRPVVDRHLAAHGVNSDLFSSDPRFLCRYGLSVGDSQAPTPIVVLHAHLPTWHVAEITASDQKSLATPALARRCDLFAVSHETRRWLAETYGVRPQSVASTRVVSEATERVVRCVADGTTESLGVIVPAAVAATS